MEEGSRDIGGREENGGACPWFVGVVKGMTGQRCIKGRILDTWRSRKWGPGRGARLFLSGAIYRV